MATNTEQTNLLQSARCAKSRDKKNHFAKLCRSEDQQRRRKKAHTAEQSESENDMINGTVKLVHEKYNKVMEFAVTGSEEKQMDDWKSEKRYESGNS